MARLSKRTIETLMPIVCPTCDSDFIPSHTLQTYCSKHCRVSSYRRSIQEKVCPLCNNTFTTGHGSQVYCSKKCYNKYRSALYISGKIRPIIMEAIMERDRYKCCDCDTDIPKVRDKYNHGYLHHITPLLSGGTDTPANIVLLCCNCHSKRHKHIKEAHTRSN